MTLGGAATIELSSAEAVELCEAIMNAVNLAGQDAPQP